MGLLKFHCSMSDHLALTFFSDDSSSDAELQELQRSLGPKVPVFEIPTGGYGVEELLRIISGQVSPSKLCVKKPCAVRTFASFVIDLEKVKLRDLAADDTGVWVTASPRHMYEVFRKHGKIVSLRHIQKIAPGMERKNVVTICRQYGTHQATPYYCHRIIATVLDHDGVVMPRAVVQYFFVRGKKVPVQTLWG